jgi:mRNA interferase RelE/StbE
MYKIILEKRASGALQQLPAPYLQRVRLAIKALANDPRPPGIRRLVDDPGYRLRVGDYRILYDIDDAAQVVTIYRIGHRREVYR